MDSLDSKSDVETLQELVSIFQGLSPDRREKMLKTISTFFDIGVELNSRFSSDFGHRIDARLQREENSTSKFSQDRTMSPKDFLLEKSPSSDVERVACLAYYLTHYRDAAHFKTVDISKLNTEAAQRKFSNAAKAVSNATRNEYIVPSTKGNKQLGAIGEVFVQELPDKEAARNAVSKLRPRSRKRAVKKIKESNSN